VRDKVVNGISDKTGKAHGRKEPEYDYAAAEGYVNDPSATQKQPQNGVNQDTQDGNVNIEEVGTCLNSGGTEEGIVSILEGFGLLDLNADGTVGTPAAAEIQGAIEEALAAIGQNDAAAEIAVQYEQNPVNGDGLPAEIGAKLGEEVTWRQRSLENTNSEDTARGAEKLVTSIRDAIVRAVKVTDNQETNDESDGMSAGAEGLVADQRVAGPASREFNPDAVHQAATPMQMEENIFNMIESISANAAKGNEEFQLQLVPEHLGRLSIKLTMEGEMIRAQIKAADMSTKSLIEAELPLLEDALRTRGIEIAKIDVTYQAAEFDFQNQQHTQSNYFSKSNAGTYALNTMGQDGLENFFDVVSGLDLYTQTSSVEFRA
jgi:hypothetical protein